MPVDRRAAIHLGLLLAAVPIQFLISRFMSTPESQRHQAIKTILSSVVGFKDDYLTLASWQAWCKAIFSKLQNKRMMYADYDDDELGESPAIEVMKLKDPQGYFAGSPTPRSPRPPEAKYRVGQVIKHKRWGYRGIIVGWDATARAPESWLDQNHPPDKPHWRIQPNYSILVDTRDRIAPQMTYVPQENIEIVTNVKVIHPAVDDYFEKWDGAQYLPRPALRTMYPHD